MGLSKLRATGAEPEPPPRPRPRLLCRPLESEEGTDSAPFFSAFLTLCSPYWGVGTRGPASLSMVSSLTFRDSFSGFRGEGRSESGGLRRRGRGARRRGRGGGGGGAVGGGRGRPGAPRVNISELRKEGGVRDATRLSRPPSPRARATAPRDEVGPCSLPQIPAPRARRAASSSQAPCPSRHPPLMGDWPPTAPVLPFRRRQCCLAGGLPTPSRC